MMGRKLFLTTGLILSIAAAAQDKMYIYQSDNITLGAHISKIDSISFDTINETGLFRINDSLYTYPLTKLDSLTFDEDSDTIFINYKDTETSVFNPMAFEGVVVEKEGCDVIIQSTSDQKGIIYSLSGTTGDGTFKLYSDKSYNLILNGVSIKNNDGPAINLQSGKKATITVAGNTVNSLTDGAEYVDPPLNSENEKEDQKAAFFSEGKIVFNGSGVLNIRGIGSDQHGLASDDWIEVNECTINIISATKDGIHAKDGFTQLSGTVSISSSGDGIDADEGYVIIENGEISIQNGTDNKKGIQCDSTMIVYGGIIHIELSGDQSKGLKSGQTMTLRGGNIQINTSGDAVLEAAETGYDPSYCTAIKSNDTIIIEETFIVISSTGIAGKGISSDGPVIMHNGTLDISAYGDGDTYTNTDGEVDSYHSSCLTADKEITITNGTLTLYNSGSGGRGISCDGDLLIGDSDNSPTLSVTTTGAAIPLTETTNRPPGPGPGDTGEADEAKTIKSDGSIFIHNGELTVSSADDGIKSDVEIEIKNAHINIVKSVEGIESPEINVSSSDVSIVASDDGFNSTYGFGGEGDDGSLLNIESGLINVNVSNGDGLDSNGDITITGGTITVHGPQSAPEVGMDYNGSCNMSGGLLIISGTNSNMTQATSSTSEYNCLKATTYTSVAANTLFHIEDADGNDIVTFAPARSYYSIIFSSEKLIDGETYSIYTGGTHNGTSTNGLFTDGVYSEGTFKKSFTISGTISNVSF